MTNTNVIRQLITFTTSALLAASCAPVDSNEFDADSQGEVAKFLKLKAPKFCNSRTKRCYSTSASKAKEAAVDKATGFTSGTWDDTCAANLFKSINGARSDRKLTTLSTNPNLTNVATNLNLTASNRSSNAISHNSDSELIRVLTSLGLSALAENISCQASCDAVHKGFMASTAHRDAILGDFTLVGIRVLKKWSPSDPGHPWYCAVQEFGRLQPR